MVFSSLEPTSVIEHHHQLQQFGAQQLSRTGPPAHPKGTLSFQLPPITALIRVLSFPQRLGGLMPALSGPRQGHSSWGGVTAGAWGRGTRQAPLGQDWASVTQPWLGVLVGGGRGGGLRVCNIPLFTSVLIHMYKQEHTAVCAQCTICKKKQTPTLMLLQCILGIGEACSCNNVWSPFSLQWGGWVFTAWLCSAH